MEPPERNDLKIYLRRFIAPAAVLLLWNPASIGAETPTTFVLTVSLPTSTMHVGEDLVVEETLSNPTDHIVVAGEGGRIGLAVELINEKGDDIGLHAMGIPGGKIV